MLASYLTTGFQRIGQRRGLVLLIYGCYLGLALLLALPLALAVEEALGPSGFGQDLVERFDLVLWVDVWEQAGDAFRGLMAQLFWLVPVLLLWKTVVAVGLTHALREGGQRSFWEGVGRYTGRALLLALAFALLLLGWSVGVVLLVVALRIVFSGAVAAFWVVFVLAPTLLLMGAAVLDLMHDYARMALVIGYTSVGEAFRRGLRFPVQHGGASWLYLAWYGLALLALAAGFFTDLINPEATIGGIWLTFLVQQVILLCRAGLVVGWYGSEVALYEDIRLQASPLIADTDAAGAPGAAAGGPALA